MVVVVVVTVQEIFHLEKKWMWTLLVVQRDGEVVRIVTACDGDMSGGDGDVADKEIFGIENKG